MSEPIPATEAEAVEQIKVKRTLTIAAEDRFKPIEQWVTRSDVRTKNETDKSRLRVIPYVSLIDENGFVFTYVRGDKGEENRLHNLKSIGVGGHIEGEVASDYSLRDLIIDTIIREVFEETGLLLSREQVLDAMNNHVVMYMPRDEVSSIHIAVAVMIGVERASLVKLADGEIIQPEWLSAHQLSVHATVAAFVKRDAMKWNFEPWSERLLAIRQTAEAFATYRADRQWAADNLGHLPELLRAFDAFEGPSGEKIALVLEQKFSDTGEELRLLIKTDELIGFRAFDIPISSDWNSLTLAYGDNSDTRTYTLKSGKGAILKTTNFLLWDIVQGEGPNVATEEPSALVLTEADVKADLPSEIVTEVVVEDKQPEDRGGDDDISVTADIHPDLVAAVELHERAEALGNQAQALIDPQAQEIPGPAAIEFEKPDSPAA